MTTKLALPVVKMHGTENTFVVIDERPPRVPMPYPELARRLCAPDGEVGGADGLLVVRDAADATAEMQIFNADGSRAEMCGNGIRCVARYLAGRGPGDDMTISTLAGPIGVRIVAREPFVACADVGEVHFPGAARLETASALGAEWTFVDVSLGNPHAVIFVERTREIDVTALGIAFNDLERFERGTNVHVVESVDRSTVRVRHYERGVGATQACGTGAVASAAAAIVLRGAVSPVTVLVPGGTLRVDWTPGEHARLTGPAETLFERTIEI